MSIAPELDLIFTKFAEAGDVFILNGTLEKFGNVIARADGAATLNIPREVGWTVVSLCAKSRSLFSSDAWWCMNALLNPKVYSWAAELLQEFVGQKLLFVPVMAQITIILRRNESADRHIDKILQLLLAIIPSYEHSLAPLDDCPAAYAAILQQLHRQFSIGTVVNRRRTVNLLRSIVYFKDISPLVPFIRAGGVSAIVRCFESVLEDAVRGDFKSTAGGGHYFYMFITNSLGLPSTVVTAIRSAQISKHEGLPAELMLDRDLCLRIRNLTYEIFLKDLAKPGKIQAHSYIESIVSNFVQIMIGYAPSYVSVEVVSYKPTGAGPGDDEQWLTLWIRWLKTLRDQAVEYKADSICDSLYREDICRSTIPRIVQNERASLVDAPRRTCPGDHCQISTEHVFTQLRKCKRCRTVYYCGKVCQEMHWPQHRTKCVKWIPPLDTDQVAVEDGGGHEAKL